MGKYSLGFQGLYMNFMIFSSLFLMNLELLLYENKDKAQNFITRPSFERDLQWREHDEGKKGTVKDWR